MVESDAPLKYVHSQRFAFTEEEKDSVRWLHCRRNEFIHYKPMRLSIDVASLRLAVREITIAMARLASESGTIIWLEVGHSGRFESATDAILEHTSAPDG